MNTRSDERGVVSIITVLFFVILLSILTVAFLRIMSDEQEQVIGDDLTKGALASARSGVEDAKRALLYCRALPAGPDKVSCEAALDETNCPGVFGSATAGTMRTALGITTSGTTVNVGGNPELNQRYTCLKIRRDTPDVKGQADENLGDFIELNTNGVPFDAITIDWHRLGTMYDGAAGVDSSTNPKFVGLNPQTTAWQNASGISYPALLRVQLLEYDPAANLSALAQKELTAFFIPVSNGNPSVAVGGVSSGSSLNRTRNFAQCVTTGDYACSLNLTGITGYSATKRYFIKLSTKYRSTNYRVQLRAGGTPVVFHDVQPEVDSTGAADNAYRRILTRVQYGTDGFYTDNAVESAESFCKSFYVTSSGPPQRIGTCSGL